MHVIKITEPDGSLTQVFVRGGGVQAMRTALRRELSRADTATRGRVTASGLTAPTTVRSALIGGGRRMSIVDADKAYRRRTTSTRSTVPDIEERICAGSTVGLRSAPKVPAGDGRTLDGYAVVFDAAYLVEDHQGDFMEVIKRGTFADSLKVRWPIAQFDHGQSFLGSMPIARYDTVTEDSHGLRVIGPVADSWLTQPVVDAIKDGRVSGMSIRFRVNRETWSADYRNRTITGAELFEAGVVVSPASPTTSVGIRLQATGTPRTRAQRRAAAVLVTELRP